ncbi:MAG TPA: sigma-E processing peptidase SpoIIGA [Limnochordia bacterium]
MPPRVVVYLDIELLIRAAEFLFDYLLLWAAAEVTGHPARKRRLAAAAAIGSAYGLIYRLAALHLLPAHALIRSWPVVVMVSALMLALAYAPVRWRRLASLGAAFYGILFCSAGAGLAAAYLLGSPDEPNGLIGRIVALAGIAVTAELGFGIWRRQVWQGLYHMPLEVVFGTRSVRALSLVDTGNRLRDPLSQLPVIVMEHEAARSVLPPQIEPALAAMEEGDLSVVSHLLSAREWSRRFRVIPFSSVGHSNGLLIGFRPDKLYLFLNGRRVPAQEAIIGLSRRPLDPAGAYQALLHPEVVQAAAAVHALRPSPKPGPSPPRGETGRLAMHSSPAPTGERGALLP